jgi:hypothetical protein
MRQHFRAGEIVDCDNFISLGAEHLSERKAADSSETVNSYSYHQ